MGIFSAQGRQRPFTLTPFCFFFGSSETIRWVQIVQRAGVDYITVHGRLRSQRSSTPPDPTLELEAPDRSVVRRAWRSRDPIPERLRTYVARYAETQVVPGDRVLWAMAAMCMAWRSTVPVYIHTVHTSIASCTHEGESHAERQGTSPACGSWRHAHRG